jgi:hypothetical protein
MGLVKGEAGPHPPPLLSMLFEKSTSHVEAGSRWTVSAATIECGADSDRLAEMVPEFTPRSPSVTFVPMVRSSEPAKST